MSEVDQTQTSTEDKFFGVKKRHGSVDAGDSSDDLGFEVELLDDAPSEEKPVEKTTASTEPTQQDSGDVSDEELSSYTKGVQKRINQLTARNKDDKRRLSEATRLKDEAVRVAQLQQKKLQEYEALLAKGQGAILESSKGKAQAELDSAEKELKKAHEEGNTDKLVESQKLLAAAQARIHDYEQREAKLKQSVLAAKRRQEEQARQPQQVEQPQQPQISPEQKEKMENWMAENPWFQTQAAEGEVIKPLHKEMTAVGLAIHDNLFHEGITANSDPDTYYAEVDRRMRQRFPDYDGFKSDQDEQEDRSAPQRQRSSTAVVAPSSSRNNGAKTRKVALTPSQRQLARTLGITNEQYAAQLISQEAG